MTTKQTRPAPEPKAAGRAKSGPPSKAGGPTPSAIALRGTPAWRAWLGRLAAHYRTTPSGLIDRALTELARHGGFEEPPRRT